MFPHGKAKEPQFFDQPARPAVPRVAAALGFIIRLLKGSPLQRQEAFNQTSGTNLERRWGRKEEAPQSANLGDGAREWR